MSAFQNPVSERADPFSGLILGGLPRRESAHVRGWLPRAGGHERVGSGVTLSQSRPQMWTCSK